jgi:hypothetical protein
VQSSSIKTSSSLRVNRQLPSKVAATTTTRWLATAATPSGLPASSPATAASTEPGEALTTSAPKTPTALAKSIEGGYKAFVYAVKDAPDADLTKAALASCLEAAAALHPQLKRAEAESRASSSRLAMLNAERGGAKFAVDAELKTAGSKISQTAYNIVTHRNVVMSQDVLELYVHIQAQLGRPESLPAVLELYAHKPKPVVKNGVVQYVPPNPNAAERAIDKSIGDMALQTAIDAKHLDAALGITEVSFCTKAFRRQKLLKHASVPALGLAGLPFGIFGLGTAYATYWQNTMDMSTATGLGVAGISGYFFVTGSLGLIAKLSHKDQMKRVTWLPGTPLRYRWMREEEREALDKIACAWGFKESWRHGEETGADWEGLREYMGFRQMILDRVEFMEGMN